MLDNPEPRKDGIEPTSDGDGWKEVASVFAGTHLLSTANCPHQRPRFPNTTDMWTINLLLARIKVVIYLFPFFPHSAWWSSTLDRRRLSLLGVNLNIAATSDHPVCLRSASTGIRYAMQLLTSCAA